RSNGLAMFGARLADEDARVDQSGDDGLAGAIHDRRAFRRALVQRAGAGCRDLFSLDNDRAALVETARRVDDAGVVEDDGGHAARPSALRRGSSSASITAMRTATPISTCSWMTLCGPSAISEAISTPRFIGPGCMTRASGFAAFSFSASSPK